MFIAFGQFTDRSAHVQPEPFSQCFNGIVSNRTAHVCQMVQKGATRDPVVEVEFAWQVADMTSQGWSGGTWILTQHREGASCGTKNINQHPHDRGFAGAVRTDQAEDRTALDPHGKVLHRHMLTKVFGQFMGFNNRGHAVVRLRRCRMRLTAIAPKITNPT